MSMGRNCTAWSCGALFGYVMRQALKAAEFANHALQALEKRVCERLIRASLNVHSFSGKVLVVHELSNAEISCKEVFGDAVRGNVIVYVLTGMWICSPCAVVSVSWACIFPYTRVAWWVTLHAALPRLCLWFCFYSLVSVLFTWQRDGLA